MAKGSQSVWFRIFRFWGLQGPQLPVNNLALRCSSVFGSTFSRPTWRPRGFRVYKGIRV